MRKWRSETVAFTIFLGVELASLVAIPSITQYGGKNTPEPARIGADAQKSGNTSR
jgi:hypothetical protein